MNQIEIENRMNKNRKRRNGRLNMNNFKRI